VRYITAPPLSAAAPGAASELSHPFALQITNNNNWYLQRQQLMNLDPTNFYSWCQEVLTILITTRFIVIRTVNVYCVGVGVMHGWRRACVGNRYMHR